MKHLLIYSLTFLFFLISTSFSDVTKSSAKKTKTTYFDDGVIAIERFYNKNDKLTHVKTYYPSGRINEIFNYNENGLNGESYKYHTDGNIQVTWKFKDRKLISRKDHLKPYTEKTKKRTLHYYEQLDILNKKIKSGTATIYDHYFRADMRSRLGFNLLALSELRRVEKALQSNKFHKKIHLGFLGSLYDCIARVYSYYELENHTTHYRYLAVNVNPSQTRLLYNLGDYLAHIKSYDLALHYLNQTKEVWPKHPFTHRALAIINLNQGNYKKALEHIQIAIKGEDELIRLGDLTEEKSVRSIRGYLLHRLGDSQKGIEDLNEALKLNPNNSYALRQLGVIYFDLKKYGKSCDLLSKAKELGFEKIHDEYDLQKYIDISCAKENKINLVKPTDQINSNTVVAINDGSPNTKSNLLTTLKKLTLYPNPASETITLKNTSTENFKYQIFSYESRLIQEGRATNASIDIAKLSQGLYLINIVEDNKNKTLRFIKK